MNDYIKPELFLYLEIEKETSLSRMLNNDKYESVGPQNFDKLFEVYEQEYDALSISLENDIDYAS